MTFVPSGVDVPAALARAKADALAEAGAIVLAESQTRVPYMTRDLMRSGSVAVDESSDRVAVTYSDPKAVAVHEDADSAFRHGRSFKFLELAAADTSDEVLQAAARHMRRAIGG